MIKKLSSLIWTLFTSKYVKYNLTNLWWYLTKGYTLSEVQDADRYILNTIKNIIEDINYYKQDLKVTSDNYFEYYELYRLINIYLSEEFELLDCKYQQDVFKYLKEYLKEIFDMWI